ncbi:MAG: thioredoxin family protein [Candidatus Sedimenticola sp. PURPLELP]
MTDTPLFTPLDSLQALEQCIAGEPAALIWFTGPDCRVCQDLKPRVGEVIERRFPKIKCFQIDCASAPDAAAQHQVFTVPTLLVFFDRQPFMRKSRNFSLAELGGELERPYSLFFDTQ